ncbi:MAG: hypothetical protein AAF518_12085 [Spirochaetota bacterium]
MNSTKPLALYIIIHFLVQSCAILQAGWYSKAPISYRTNRKDLEVSIARLQTQGVTSDFWSATVPYNVLWGTFFIPFYDIEAPILNNSNLHMHWEIHFDNDKVQEVKIPKKAFSIKTSRGAILEVSGLSIRVRSPEGYASFTNYYGNYEFDAFPETITVKENSVLELIHQRIFYAQEDWYEMRPSLLIDGKEVQVPTIRFTPDRYYNYKPFVIPYAVPLH